ncbi:MAG: cupin domain-containing protein [Aureibaculum sp.]|nr:cupin domain-containing protein [Aureibaculum sp.]
MNANIIAEIEIKGLQVVNIFKTDSAETLLISLEKGKLFPTHTSPKTTFLVVLEGNIDFFIENKTVTLAKHQSYTFQKSIEHKVAANENSKFLIIR